MKIPWHKRTYALYKGDRFIAAGTIREISKTTDKKINTLNFMTYPAYKKRCGNSENRLKLISLDDIEKNN